MAIFLLINFIIYHLQCTKCVIRQLNCDIRAVPSHPIPPMFICGWSRTVSLHTYESLAVINLTFGTVLFTVKTLRTEVPLSVYQLTIAG